MCDLTMKSFSIVVASLPDGGIGHNNSLPWPIKRGEGDMKWFYKLTTNVYNHKKQNAVIMGKNTYLSIVEQLKETGMKSLPNRKNFVLTQNTVFNSNETKDVEFCSSLDQALDLIERSNDIEHVFVIGGGKLYNEALKHPKCQSIWYTHVLPLNENTYKSIQSDVKIEKDLIYKLYQSESEIYAHSILDGFEFETVKYIRKPHEEMQYINTIKRILREGKYKDDRTKTGVISIFGNRLTFDLQDSFPILTTKKVFWKGVVKELLWFIKGQTDNKILQQDSVNIWNGNSTREYLDGLGFTNREEGDLGPVYGYQWRHFGAKYIDCHTDYAGQGVDQLAHVITTIQTNPDDRRLIMSAWNPTDLKEMALPACHILSQFYVQNGKLSCQMYQRSADWFLGTPFNIASYSLLTCMIAQICNLKPGQFSYVTGDSHLYSTHLGAALEQVQRTPFPFPQLNIKRQVELIDDFVYEDFELVGYQSHNSIQAKMAV